MLNRGGLCAGRRELGLGLGLVGRLPLTIQLGFALGFLGLTQPLAPSGQDLSQIQERDQLDQAREGQC